MSATGGVNLASMNPGGLKFEIGPPGSSDKVVISTGTTLTLGQLDFADFTFTSLPGITAGTYTLFDAGSTMAATIGSATGSIGSFNATLSMDNTSPNFDIYLTLTAGGTPGDYNNDTKVNAADYVTWRKDPTNNGGANGYATWPELQPNIGQWTRFKWRGQRRSGTGLADPALFGRHFIDCMPTIARSANWGLSWESFDCGCRGDFRLALRLMTLTCGE